MLRGFSLSPHVEHELWRRFEHWPEHFKARLRTDGVDGLLGDYEALVRSVETQSCFHGAAESIRTGEDWQWCCGVSYEYRNDIAVRDALAVFLDVIPAEEARFRQTVAALDARLRACIESETDTETARWWERLPRGVVE